MSAIFERLVIFTFPGVSRSTWPEPFQVTAGPGHQCTVRLVPSLDTRTTLHADQDAAVRWGLLRATPYGSPGFEELVEEVRGKRPKADGYAVITVRGPTVLDMAQMHVDMGDVVVGFELVSGQALREATADVVGGVAAALAVTAQPGRLKRIVDSFYYFDFDGRAYYSSTPKVGSVTAAVSLDEASVTEFVQLATRVSGDAYLGRALRLLTSTFDPGMDPFQKMVTLWTGLEVLCNKLYPQYQARFTEQAAPPYIEKDVELRIRESKANLSDKFRLLAAYLREESATEDGQLFKSLIRARHNMMHSGELPDLDEYSGVAARLLIQYIGAYARA